MPGLILEGASAIVTGAGSGINFAFAKTLHARGCNVLIADIGLRAEAEAFIESIAQNADPKVAFQKTDVTDWNQLEALFDKCEEAFGATPDLVCCGAGIYEPPARGFWADKDAASHYKILDVNLLHPIKLTRIAVRKMLRAKKGGCILHIASVACQTASLITPLYSVSKHGVAAFVRGQAQLQEICGVRVVCIAPGSIATPLLLEEAQVTGWFNKEKDVLLDPAVLAKAMLAVTEDKDGSYPAGTILEVTDNEEHQWRKVPLYNNPGPQGRAISVSNKDAALAQIKEYLSQDAGDGTIF